MAMKRIIVLFLLSLSIYTATAQRADVLLTDPRIVTGELANGLKYYIVKNPVNKGSADFYLIQRAGSIVEPDDFKGMTRILGGLAMRGTRNFPENTILSYLESFSIEQGSGIDIDILDDRAIYGVSEIAVNRSANVIDSCLLILYNWAGSINIDDEDLERERLLLRNRVAGEVDARNRVRSKLLNKVSYGGDSEPFTDRHKILSDVDNYSTRALRHFYYNWFRPDLQAIVVAGDIDTKEVEGKIKTLFQASPRPLNPIPFPQYEVADSEGIEVIIVTDPELTTSRVNISFKSDPLPEDLMASALPLFLDFMYGAVADGLNERLAQAFGQESVPIISYRSAYDKFLGLTAKESFNIKIESDPTDVPDVLRVISNELERVREHGFSSSEINRYRNRYVNDLERRYKWRELTSNDTYMKKVVGNFFENKTMASMELERELMVHLVATVSKADFNIFASSVLRRDENIFISVESPEGSYDYSQDQLLAAWTEGFSKQTSPLKEETSISNLIRSGDQSGSVLTETKDPITGSTVWTLSNGATVIVKNSGAVKGEVSFKAVAKGGYSLMKPDKIVNGHLINDIFQTATFTGYDRQAVNRLFYDKGIVLKSGFTLSEDVLYGRTEAANISLFLQAVNLSFRGMEKDSLAFARLCEVKRGELRLKENDPEIVLNERTESLLYNNSRYSSVIERFMINELDYDYAMDFIGKRFSNAANFIFVFTGDIEPSSIKESVSRYIGSLPGDSQKKDSWQIVPYYISKQNMAEEIEIDMVEKRTVHKIILSGASPYTAKGVVEAELLYRMLKRRIETKMATHGIACTVEKSTQKYPEEYMKIIIRLTHTDNPQNIQNLFDEIWNELLLNGINSKEYTFIKKSYQSEWTKMRSGDNDFWMDMITSRYLYGVDLLTNHDSILSSISEEDANRLLRKFADEGYRIYVTMVNRD